MATDLNETSVYLSFRRENAPWALAIYHGLAAQGCDVFLNYAGLAGEGLAAAMDENLRARTHFLALVTPSALKRCIDPNDELRGAIETALACGRNVVPLYLEGFHAQTPSIAAQLTGKLAELAERKGLELPVRYLKYALQELADTLRKTATEAPLRLSPAAAAVARLQKEAAEKAQAPTSAELTAQYWFERASNAGDPEEIIRYYDAAIAEKPDYAAAYLNRGNARLFKGDLDGAVGDYSETIRVAPGFANAYFNRGAVRLEKGAYAEAIADFDEALRLEPDDALTLQHRAQAKEKSGDAEGAQQDNEKACELGLNG